MKDEKLDARKYGMRDQLGALVSAANYLPGHAAMVEFGANPDGAVVVLKGQAVVEAFKRWAVEKGLLASDKRGKMKNAYDKATR